MQAARTEPIKVLGERSIDDLAEYALPIIVGTVCLVTFFLTMGRAGLVIGWADDFSGAGSFVVEGCRERSGIGADQWLCEGTLFADGAAAPISSTLVTSAEAVVSDRPYVGQEFEVFFRNGDSEPETVYADVDRLNELTRLYLSLLPRALLFGGSTIWLLGWFFTLSTDSLGPVERDKLRLPGRFAWRSRGATWMIAGLIGIGLNYFLATRIVGSLGIS